MILTRTATTINIVNARRDGGDQFFYHVTANLLARGRGFINPVAWAQDGIAIPSALHGPAFPIALSFWSRLGGTTYFDHQLVSVLLGIPQVVFGVMLAHLIAGRRTAIVAAVLLLAYPNIWVTDGSMWVEGMMAGITTAATFVMYRWRISLRLGTIALAGALIGAAALTRGEAILMTVLMVLPMVVTSELSRKMQFRHLAVCAASFIAVIAPWMIYNATRFDLFVPLSTNSNEVIYYANCPDSYYGPKVGYWSFACQERYRAEFGDPPGDESVRNQAYRDLGLEYARDTRVTSAQSHRGESRSPVGTVPAAPERRLRFRRRPTTRRITCGPRHVLRDDGAGSGGLCSFASARRSGVAAVVTCGDGHTHCRVRLRKPSFPGTVRADSVRDGCGRRRCPVRSNSVPITRSFAGTIDR